MKKILFLLFLLISINAGATKYYISTTGVDNAGRNGLVGQEWATLSYACTRATTAGDTIMVGVGTFTETAQSTVAVGVSIMGAGVTSIIKYTYANTTWSNACIELESANEGTLGNQSISHLTIDGDSVAYHGILIGRRSNVSLHDLTMTKFRHNGINFRGSYVNETEPTIYATNNTMYNCTLTKCIMRVYDMNYYDGSLKVSFQDGIDIHDNVIDNSEVTEGYAANNIDFKSGYNKNMKFYRNKSYKPPTNGGEWNFHIESWDGMGGNHIYDNEFYGFGFGVDIGGHFNIKGNYAYSWLVEDNIFINTEQHALIDDKFEGGVGVEGNSSDIIIRRNYFKNIPTGVSLNAAKYGSLVYDIKRVYVSYNILEDIAYTNQNAWAFYIHNGSVDAVLEDVYFDNNTVISLTGNQTDAAFFVTPVGPMNNIRIRNNIIHSMRIAPIYMFTETGQVSNVYNQNNIYYNNGYADTIRYYLTPLIINYVDEDNIRGYDPLFVGGSPYSYKLQATSPARDAGLSVGLTSDYGGYSVPVGSAPDIGAWEYGADVDPPNWTEQGIGWDRRWQKINFRDSVNFTRGFMIAGVPISASGSGLEILGGLEASVDDLNATAGATGNFQGQINAIKASTVDDSKADTSLSNLASVAINTHLLPGTDGAVNLGSATYKWGNIFMDSAKVVNWNNGDVTITHSVNKLTMAGGTLDLPSGVHRMGTDTIASKADARAGGGGDVSALEARVDSIVTVLADTANIETLLQIDFDTDSVATKAYARLVGGSGSGYVLLADSSSTAEPNSYATGNMLEDGLATKLNTNGTAATVTGFTPASGSLTLSGADAITLTTTAATGVTLPTTGTLATTTQVALKADLTVVKLNVDTIGIFVFGKGDNNATDSVGFAKGAKGFGSFNNKTDTLYVVDFDNLFLTSGDSLIFNAYYGNRMTGVATDSLFTNPQPVGTDENLLVPTRTRKIPPGMDVWLELKSNQLTGYRPKQWEIQLNGYTIRDH